MRSLPKQIPDSTLTMRSPTRGMIDRSRTRARRSSWAARGSRSTGPNRRRRSCCTATSASATCGRRRRDPSGARLGARPPRRPDAGPRLAMRAGLALRWRGPGRRLRRRTRICSAATSASAAARSIVRAVRWWEAVRDGLVGRRLHAAGVAPSLRPERSVELAAIGRRVWEQEYDVLLRGLAGA